MAGEWIDVVDDNGDDIRVLSPADEELISVVMDESDWKFVIESLRFRASKNLRTSDTRERAEFTADSIQDVLSSL